MFGRFVYVAIFLLVWGGCSQHLPPTYGPLSAWPSGAPPGLMNPLFVPLNDHELVWNQTVDAIDDYFKIEREERIRLVGGVITEGRIETVPTTGATLLEPWHGDSTPGFQRWLATLQSIRRRASVRVMPVSGGYSIEVAVFQELEDLDRPEHSTVGNSTLTYETSMQRNRRDAAPGPITLGWIALGRDVTLEQKILADLQARLTAQPDRHLGLHGLH